MKKFFSALLAAALVAASALTASAGMYVYDESDGEYWDAALNMLDKTAKVVWVEDGTAGDYGIAVSTTDSTEIPANSMSNLASGWYEAVLCNLGSNAEDFPAEVEGKIALTVRGDSTFTIKSENAANAGAVACFVLNNCRPEEMVDETGTVSSGTYAGTNMSVEYDTLPMCILSSDMGVKLVAATTGASIAEVVEAITAISNGVSTDLGLEAKNSTWVFVGTEEEFKAAGEPGAAVVEEAVVEEPAAEEAVVEETVEEVVEEIVVEEAATETVEEVVVEEAAQTFDFGVIAAVAAVVSAAGYAISKKR